MSEPGSTSRAPTGRRRRLDLLERAVGAAALVGFAVMVAVTLLQVLARYALQVTIPWTEELARLLFVAAMMLGIAVAHRRGEHVAVDFLFLKLGRRAQEALRAVFDVAILGLLVVWAAGAWRLMLLNRGSTFIALDRLPVSWIYGVELFAIALLALFTLADLLRRLGARP